MRGDVCVPDSGLERWQARGSRRPLAHNHTGRPFSSTLFLTSRLDEGEAFESEAGLKEHKADTSLQVWLLSTFFFILRVEKRQLRGVDDLRFHRKVTPGSAAGSSHVAGLCLSFGIAFLPNEKGD